MALHQLTKENPDSSCSVSNHQGLCVESSSRLPSVWGAGARPSCRAIPTHWPPPPSKVDLEDRSSLNPLGLHSERSGLGLGKGKVSLDRSRAVVVQSYISLSLSAQWAVSFHHSTHQCTFPFRLEAAALRAVGRLRLAQGPGLLLPQAAAQKMHFLLPLPS